MLISMHSILGWASFCMNYCINVAWHGGNQPVALLRCNESPGCFDSSLQVICIFESGVSHLPLDNTYRFSMVFRSGGFLIGYFWLHQLQFVCDLLSCGPHSLTAANDFSKAMSLNNDKILENVTDFVFYFPYKSRGSKKGKHSFSI